MLTKHVDHGFLYVLGRVCEVPLGEHVSQVARGVIVVGELELAFSLSEVKIVLLLVEAILKLTNLRFIVR